MAGEMRALIYTFILGMLSAPAEIRLASDLLFRLRPIGLALRAAGSLRNVAFATFLLPAGPPTPKKELFQTSDRCFACHNGLSTSAGEDISIGFSWRPTMMANAARDPYWQAGVRRETMDHRESKAAIEDECSKCHMPMARYQSKFEGREGEVFSRLQFGSDNRLDQMAQDGVSCSLCHQITKEKLGTPESLVGGFVVDTTRNRGEREEYGPFKIDDGEDLGVIAMPQEFEAAATRTIEHLKSKTAQISIDRVDVSPGRLRAELSVQNLSGHKFPTAYPSRRAWLHVTVKDRGGRTVFESGALNPDGSIQGNDNDADPNRFEPHYTEINTADQVQIYEDIMVGANNMPTTGLLTAVRFIKDNRLLPRGFNNETADPRTLPQGGAANDPNFTGAGDKIIYSVSTGNAEGPFQVEAEFWFQPISFRWANNLKPYNAPEPKRFTGYYDAMASGSAVMLCRAAK